MQMMSGVIFGFICTCQEVSEAHQQRLPAERPYSGVCGHRAHSGRSPAARHATVAHRLRSGNGCRGGRIHHPRRLRGGAEEAVGTGTSCCTQVDQVYANSIKYIFLTMIKSQLKMNPNKVSYKS